MTEFATLTYNSEDAVGLITLNRPDERNAFNQKMRLELIEAVKLASQDNNTHVIVIAAAGKVFCAGADLSEPFQEHKGAVTEQLQNEYMPSLLAIRQAKKPFIAAGIGVSLALHCDLCVMAEDAFLYSAFGTISLIPDGGLHWLLSNQVGKNKAYEIIVESQRLNAEKCLQLGLVNKVVPSNELLNSTLTWAKKLTQIAPLTARYSKEVLRQVPEQTLEQNMKLEAQLQDYCIRSDDFKEGTAAFFEKRIPRFQGK